MLLTQVGRPNIDRKVYPDLDGFAEDTAAAYRAEIADLYAAGCRYLQLDDVSLAYLCDENMRAEGRTRGDDPDVQLALSVKMVRGALRDKPADLTVCTHLCRGNFRSSWRAQGGYERVAETVFTQMPYDGFFLEFDDARSGDFSPLRHVPKHGAGGPRPGDEQDGRARAKDDLKRRLDEAAKYVPLDQLGLSPQCGFSSTSRAMTSPWSSSAPSSRSASRRPARSGAASSPSHPPRGRADATRLPRPPGRSTPRAARAA